MQVTPSRVSNFWPFRNYYIAAPLVLRDSETGEYLVFGQVEWRNAQAIQRDAGFWGGNVGGRDAAGLLFTNITELAAIKIREAAGYDRRNHRRWRTQNTALIPRDGTKAAVIFEKQDYTFSEPLGLYNCWKITTSLWLEPEWNDRGEATMTYGHNWNSTELSGVDFTTGSDGTAVTGGLVFHWTRTENRFATNGAASRY